MTLSFRNYEQGKQKVFWQWFSSLFSEIVFMIEFQVAEYCCMSPLKSAQKYPLHKKWSFLLRISSLNATKSTGNCGFCHIYWRNPKWKASFFVQRPPWNTPDECLYCCVCPMFHRKSLVFWCFQGVEKWNIGQKFGTV